MAASLSDQAFLSSDSAFQGRVKQALIGTCINIQSEAITVSTLQQHIARARFCVEVLQPGLIDSWKILIAAAVATDVSCLADATAGGTVVLTTANAPAQAALVTDAHITNAIAAQFNAFFNLTF